MNYYTIKKTDIANGPGVRVSLFVSGCNIRCKGCFNAVAWPFDSGVEYTTETTKDLIAALKPAYISGLSVLGGEPLAERNILDVMALCHDVKAVYPKKTIWLYTGYTYETLTDKQKEILQFIDVLVDGPFIIDKKDISLSFKGSSNQRIIDVKKTLKAGHVEEVEL